MGADPQDEPSGFSVVSDSIRRDREVLFSATRADVPTIDDEYLSDGSSDLELPVFFTTPGGRARESRSDGVDVAGMHTELPLDFGGKDATSRGVHSYGHTDDYDNNQTSQTSSPSDAEQLAAFERQATENMKREEDRAQQAVVNHLNSINDNDRVVQGTYNTDDYAVAAQSDEDNVDENWDDSSSDEEVSVRARRRPPPKPRRRERSTTETKHTDVPTRTMSSDTSHVTSKTDTQTTRQKKEFTGWLSGAAGRLASDRSTATNETGHVSEFHTDPDAFTANSLAQLENEFSELTQFSQNSLDEHGNLPEHLQTQMPPPSVDINLSSALGGLDLDGLLKRLKAPGGESLVHEVRERSRRERVVDLGLDEEDVHEQTVSTNTNELEGWVEGKGRGRGRSVSKQSRETDRPHTARPRSTGAGREAAPTRDLNPDPYGRGTNAARRVNQKGAGRPQSASPSVTPTKKINSEPLKFTGADVVQSGTVKINAWDTFPVADESKDSKDTAISPVQKKEALKSVTGSVTPPASPEVARAEAAAVRATAAAKAAKEAVACASLEADDRESIENTKRQLEAHAIQALEQERERHSEQARAKVKAKSEAGKAMDAYLARKKSKTKVITPALTIPPSKEQLLKCETNRVEGNGLFRKGDYLEAVALFTQALQHNPNDVSSLANRAAAKLALSDWSAAESDTTACLQIEPLHEKAPHRRAKALTQLGRYEEALTDLEALQKRLPNHEATQAELANARRRVAHQKDGGFALEREMEIREKSRRDAAEREEEAWEAKRAAGVEAHRARALATKHTKMGK